MQLEQIGVRIMILMAFLATVACGGTTKQAIEEKAGIKEKLKAEVMSVHDDAMAKMGELYNLEIAIKEATDSTDVDELALAETRIRLLQKANREMMDWMKQYQEPESKNEKEIKDFYSEQMASILKVKVLTDSSIVLANQFLEK